MCTGNCVYRLKVVERGIVDILLVAYCWIAIRSGTFCGEEISYFIASDTNVGSNFDDVLLGRGVAFGNIGKDSC